MDLPLEHVPVATPLPEMPATDFLDQYQWDVLMALIDAVFPSIVAKSSVKDEANQLSIDDKEFEQVLDNASKSMLDPASNESLRSFLECRPSEDANFVNNVKRTLSTTPPAHVKRLGGLLSILATRPGSLLTTGYWQPIYNQPAHVRVAIFRSWVTSMTVSLRSVAKTVTLLAQKANSHTSPLLKELSGYTDRPVNWKAGPSFDYNFVQFQSSDEPAVVETDVVVVGSGCGGGVCAKNLAEAGHRVMVVDKGHHFPPSHLPMPQDAATSYMFDNSGIYVTEDNGCNITAGSVWGGGGTVNWSVCLKLQDFVQQEWADAGLPFFTSSEFDKCVDRVSSFVGAHTTNLRHNHRNSNLLSSCKKLGWAAKEAPQNTAGKEHYCGQCHLGCGSAEKRGPATSWLPEAAAAGAEFIEGFQADKVIFDEDGETAIGVEGDWTSRDASGGLSGCADEKVKRRVIVRAKKVILTAGTLWDPIILLRSGITNPNVGSNLHIHPCNLVTAVHKEETRPWEGGIITSYSSEFENLDGNGHGVKLEPTCMVPYTILSMAPWTSGLDAKLLLLKYPHLSAYISLTRDRDSGRVFADPDTGLPRVDYTASDFDREHTLDGVQGLAKICYVAGATEIRPFLPNLEPFIPKRKPSVHEDGTVTDPEFSDPDFAAWLVRLREIGNKPPTTTWSSAHQMGTCRMSATEAGGVVDPKGQVWGRKNLYVADASVFPNASGVNPMITVLTIADMISRSLDKDWDM